MEQKIQVKNNLINQTFNYFTVIGGPIKKGKKIYWICRCKCGNIKEVRADLLKSGNTKSCGCFKKAILIQENIKRQTLHLEGQIFGKLTALEPTKKRSKDGRVIWKCKCECGNICYVDTHSLQEHKVSSCGCLKSKGEYIIETILKNNNINYETQYSFETCRFPENNYYAKFDFYIDNKYLIEYDGEQHFYFKNNPHTWNTEENFNMVQQHDNFKNEWCKKNNIPLIRIPYTYLDEICLEDLLLEKSKFVI